MNLNFNEICRLCLRICEEYVDLSQTNGVKTLANDLVEKIKYCYVVKIDSSQGFPTKVCYECIQVLSFFYTAKKNVIVSEQLLRDILCVRRKIQEGTKNHEEENMQSPDIIEIKQDEQNIRPTVMPSKKSELEKSNENNEKTKNEELNCNQKHVNTSESRDIPVIDVKEEKKICVNYNHHISPLSMYDSGIKKKKKFEQLQQGDVSTREKNAEIAHLKKPISEESSNVELSLEFKDLKKQHCQNGKTSKPTKGKTVLGTDPPLKESVVKVIGTVIDTNNILSPKVKRTRKSILAS